MHNRTYTGDEINSPRVGSDYFPSFSDAEFQRRHHLVRQGMREQGLDVLLIHGFHHQHCQDQPLARK